MPEERSEKSNHNNAKDKAPRVATEGSCRERSAGRDRSCETTRSPASKRTPPDINKDFLNLVLQLQMLADTGWRLQPEAGSAVVAAEPDVSRRRLCRRRFRLRVGRPIDLCGTGCARSSRSVAVEGDSRMAFKVQVGPAQIAIHQGQSVLLTEPDGQVNWPSNRGLYFRDTRVISAGRSMPMASRGTCWRPNRPSSGAHLPD